MPITEPKFIFTKNIGDGINLSFIVNHNFGTKYLNVFLINNIFPYNRAKDADYSVEYSSSDSITIKFSVAPTLNAYEAIIMD